MLGRHRTFDAQGASRRDETLHLQIIFLLGAILGPIVVLTLDIAKSAVASGTGGPPFPRPHRRDRTES
jgi:hypothetical protein